MYRIKMVRWMVTVSFQGGEVYYYRMVINMRGERFKSDLRSNLFIQRLLGK